MMLHQKGKKVVYASYTLTLAIFGSYNKMIEKDIESICIRHAEKIDAATLVKFNLLLARETESKELIPEVVCLGVENLLENLQRGFYIVAESHGEVIASLMITTEWSDWRNGSFWWVQSVYVMPEWRKKSVYRRMYQYVRTLAKSDESVCGFRLYVEKDNVVAQQTYKKMGMNITNYMMFEESRSGLKYLKTKEE
jgi:ribosomal protein S18 acetylase RimI-like enzyme